MRKLMLVLSGTLTACISLKAQEALSDRWKETQRFSLKGKTVNYTDTLRLSGVSQNEMSLRKGSFQYKGKISNNVLDMGYLTYRILKNKENEIKLEDDEFIHVFTRELRERSAADASEKKAGIELPSSPVAKIDPVLLQGDWEAYKRTSRSGPLPKIDYQTLIKTLSYALQKPEDYYGSVTTNLTGNGDVLYFIKDIRATGLVVDDKNKKEHILKVWRLTPEELVIEDEAGIIYFMKHFP